MRGSTAARFRTAKAAGGQAWSQLAAGLLLIGLFTPPHVAKGQLGEDAPDSEGAGTQLLKTNSLDITPPGSVRVGVSASFQRGVTIPFSGLSGDLWQLGTLRVDGGLGRGVEVQVRGTIRQRLTIDAAHSAPSAGVSASEGTTHDVGDFTVTTIFCAKDEKGAWPAIGLRVEAKLPNTDETKGIGTNSTDVILAGVLEKRISGLRVFADVGLGILSEPTILRSQNDVLVYGVATTYALGTQVRLMVELNGRWAPSGYLPGTEDHSQLRGGLGWKQGGLTCELLLTHGLTRWDESFGAALAVSFGFRLARGTVR